MTQRSVTIFVLVLAASGLIFTGCSKNGQTENEEEVRATSASVETAPPEEVEMPAEQQVADEPEASIPGPERRTADALRQFAFQFSATAFSRSQGSENVVLSPWSLHSTLMLLTAGANNETWEELANGLGYTGATLDQLDQMLEASAALTDRLMPSEDSVELRFASRAWVEEELSSELLNNYRDAIQLVAESPLETADFRGSPDGERERINAWVSEQTEGEIDQLIPPSVIDAATNLILTNAVYFVADWALPFEPEHTTEEPFYPFHGDEVMVPMMRRGTMSLRHWSTDVFQAVEVPYEGEEYALALFLPAAGKYGDFEELLLEGDPRTVLPEARDFRRVNLSMPRAEIGWSASLKRHLETLGIRTAFTGDADFSRMFQHVQVAVTNVQHEAHIQINEQGTVATAATSVAVGTTSAAVEPPLPFRVDRPYYVMVIHRETDAPLFIGRIVNPAPESADEADGDEEAEADE